MNSIEININDFSINTNIYISVKRNTIIINNQDKSISQEKINELLRIIRTWKNNSDAQNKIIDQENYIIKINTYEGTEIIKGIGYQEKNYSAFKNWIGEFYDGRS